MPTQKKFAQQFMSGAIRAATAQIKQQQTQPQRPEPSAPKPKPEASTARPSAFLRQKAAQARDTSTAARWTPSTPESIIALPTTTTPDPNPSLSQRLDTMSQIRYGKPFAEAFPTSRESEIRSYVANGAPYTPARKQSAQLSQATAALDLQIKQVKAQGIAAKEKAQPGPSSYLTGGTPTPSGIPYAAALQYEPWDSKTAETLQLLQSMRSSVKVELDAQSYEQRSSRLMELAAMSSKPTALEAAEIKAGIKYLDQWIEPRLNALNQETGGWVTTETIKGTQLEEAMALRGALREKTPDGLTSSVMGLSSAIPGMGAFLRHADQVERDSAVGNGKLDSKDFLPRDFSRLDAMRSTGAYRASKAIGDIGMAVAGAKAIKAIPAIAKLSPALQNILAYAGVMGSQEVNDAATEGAEPVDIFKRGVIATAGGAVGGVTSSVAEKVGGKVLKAVGLKDAVLSNMFNQGLSGATFSAGSMGTQALLDPNYHPSSDEIVYALGVPFIFVTLSSAINMGARSKAAKVQLDYEAELLKQDYAKTMWDYLNGRATTEQALVDLEARTQRLRDTLNNTQYIGHGKEVKDALDVLDIIDDQINAAWTGTGGANSGNLALSSGTLPDTGMMPTSPMVPTLPTMTAAEAQALYQPFIDAYAKEQFQAKLMKDAKPLVERILQARDDALVERTRTEYAEGFADYEAKRRQNQATHVEDEETAEQKPRVLSLPDVPIYIGVGAKAKNYEVVDKETGEVYHFLEGTHLQNVEVFAGSGVRTPLEDPVSEGLAQQFGGEPGAWQHVKGIGELTLDGEESRLAEVHWFQAVGVEKVKFVLKRWLDE